MVGSPGRTLSVLLQSVPHPHPSSRSDRAVAGHPRRGRLRSVGCCSSPGRGEQIHYNLFHGGGSWFVELAAVASRLHDTIATTRRPPDRHKLDGLCLYERES